MNFDFNENLEVFDTFCHNNNESENFSENCDTNKADFECVENDIELNNNNKSVDLSETLLKDEQEVDVNCLNTNDNINTIENDINIIKGNELSVNSMKRNIDINSDNYNKRIKFNINNTDIDVCDHFKSDLLNNQLSPFDFQLSANNSNEEQTQNNCKTNSNNNESVPKNESNDNNNCDINNDNDLKPKKTPKHVKWRENVVNEHFNEDILSNVLLSETYYYYGIGLVTGEQGLHFGGNRFQGFSRHLFSDESGITVELCKPFIINHIIIELENKTHKKSPLFSYKVLIAIDECMTDWDLIKDCTDISCFGEQDIHFYPRFVQYIRIVGSHGIYCENNRESEARYFTLLNFDCIFETLN